MAVSPHSSSRNDFSTVEAGGRGWSYIALSGTVERAPTPPARPLESLVLVDLEGVSRVTSAGGRALGEFLGRLGGASRNVVLVDCPPPVVALLNLVRGFVGPASVLSIKAPYYCEKCGAERSLSLPVEVLAGKDEPDAPALLCEDDGTTLVFDDIEKSYFAFTKRVQFARADPELERLVGRARRRAAGDPADEPAPTPREPVAISIPVPDASLSRAIPADRVIATRLPAADRAFWVVVGALVGVLALVVYHFTRG